MDMRKEAENRVKRKQQENDRKEMEIQRHRMSLKKSPVRPVVDSENKDNNNLTPNAAKLAAVDFQLNGSRFRSESGDFIMPRWIPDEETNNCQKCATEFDMVNRKHHCRHCGLLVCHECSKYILMLPHHFGFREPQRVCMDCNAELLPLQMNLSNNIANHHRVNNIELVDGNNCNVRRYFNFPISLTLGSEIRKAAYSTYNLFSLQFLKDKAIPLRLLESAKGIAYLTVAKGGFVVAPRIGTGLVISKLVTVSGEHLWSAPCAIATVGVGVGFMVGFDVTDYVVVLNTDEAVKAFSGVFQATVGMEIEVAVGPVGRSGSADVHISQRGVAPAYSYSHSRGLFVGASLDGTVIMTRNDVNHKFYGRPVSAEEILSGKVPPPRAAASLYQALSDAVSSTPFVTHAVTPKRLSSGGVSVGGRKSTDSSYISASNFPEGRRDSRRLSSGHALVMGDGESHGESDSEYVQGGESGAVIEEPNYEVVRGAWATGRYSSSSTMTPPQPPPAQTQEPIVLPLFPFMNKPSPSRNHRNTSSPEPHEPKPVHSPKNERDYEVPYEYGVRRDISIEQQIESEVTIGL